MLVSHYLIKTAFKQRKFNLGLVFGCGIVFNPRFSVKKQVSQYNFNRAGDLWFPQGHPKISNISEVNGDGRF
jgi:hypothetical protein